jgi:hypothetical protein
MFGPSVPIYLTEFMEGRGRPTKSGPLDGEGRRTIYLEVRRNFLAPMMRTFDAPVPFSTIGRRTVSNVPAQSLILMNDPFVVEEASIWAGKMLKATKLSIEERLLNLYETAYARAPTAEECASAIAFIYDQGQRYGLTADEAKSDLRVWTDLCHVAFNVKEFIYLK